MERPEQDDLNELARRLGAWRPAPAPTGRDRLLFEAGRAAATAEARRRGWRLVAAMVVVSAGLGGVAHVERTRRLASEALVASGPAPSPAPIPPPARAAEPGPHSYFVLSRRMLAPRPDPEPARAIPEDAPATPAPRPLRARGTPIDL